MITHRFTAEADAAALRYGTIVEGWRGLYQRALDGAAFGSARQIRKINEEAFAMGRSFLASEIDQIERATAEIALEAHTATLRDLRVETADSISEATGEHLVETERYLRNELAIQIERDIGFLMISLRRAALQINLAATARGVSRRTALMQYRIGNTQELHFFFHDRGNQKWPSRKFVRAIWRHHLLGVYNETVLMTLSERGAAFAEVMQVNPKAETNGLRVAMAPDSDLPTYSEIRNEIFHPNADAVLKGVA